VLAGPRWETVDALPISSTPDALPSAALAEPRWEGWEDVEFELLYAEGEERER
jgi:hypothetical protein